ncbi:hypothetical protein AB0D87_45090, partial [Streptomyces sp. NPDC048342]|uniref:hypothetical protein n=1 Tax=Streptomyces sp. NPDC048342 TaxID=3154716 RepID=UPI003424A109
PKGHYSFIFRTAPFPEADLQPTPFHVQDTRPGLFRDPQVDIFPMTAHVECVAILGPASG